MLGIDYGARRIGLALSDATATLASPWRLLQRPPSEAETLRMMITEIMRSQERRRRPRGGRGRLAASSRWLAERSDADRRNVRAALEGEDRRAGGPPGRAAVEPEAESRLARRETDWRKRKQKLDAAAAAVILQDYLDGRSRDRTCHERGWAVMTWQVLRVE